MKKLAVVSLSGGMDSTSLAVRLLAEGYTIQAIGFDYGQRHKVELERAESFVEYMKQNNYPISFHKIDLTTLSSMLHSSLIGTNIEVPKGHYEDESMKSTVVPNRNVIFSSITYAVALSLAEREKSNVVIALGVHAGDHAIYPDCTEESVSAAENLFKISNWGSENVQYIRPFVSIDKTRVLQQGIGACLTLGVDWREVYKRTSTSYDPTPEGKAGNSSSDVERVEAFMTLGLVDPVEYEIGWEKMVEYVTLLCQSRRV